MKVDLYSQSGNKLKDTVDLPKEIFAGTVNESLLAQYVRVYLANQRMGTSKVKDRGEVSGGGRKPWRQKGTGRARHGSIRSPIWVGGGTVHGPSPRDWSLRMSKKMRRRALFSALSARSGAGLLRVVKEIKLAEPKTKKVVEVIDKLGLDGKVLLVLGSVDESVILSARNLPQARTIQARELNAYEVLDCNWLVLTKEAVGVIEETFAPEREAKDQSPKTKDIKGTD